MNRLAALDGRILALVLVLLLAASTALAFRVGMQGRDLNDAHAAIAFSEETIGESASRAATPLGPPLLGPGDQASADLTRQLAALGLRVTAVHPDGDSSAAGAGVALSRFVVEGSGDAATVQRIGRWVQGNAGSASLERLTMTAPATASSAASMAMELAVLTRAPVIAAPDVASTTTAAAP